MADARTAWAVQMAAFAYVQGGGPKEDYVPPPREDTRKCYKCGSADHLAAKCPLGGPYVPAPDRQPKYEPPPAAASSSHPAINFGVRGDSLMQIKHDGGSKYAKKWRTFKADMESQFWEVFGDCTIDYSIDGMYIKDITTSINNGPAFDILVVGITCNELFVPSDMQTWTPYNRHAKNINNISPFYPPGLDDELQALATAILSKSKGSLVLVGGPSELWDYPPRWDTFIEQASNTLRRSGVQVVPRETAHAVMNQMDLSDDGIHFANSDRYKEFFAKSWAGWLVAAAADISFGRLFTEDFAQNSQKAVFAATPTVTPKSIVQAVRAKSRSPRRTQQLSLPAASAAASSSAAPALPGGSFALTELMKMGFG